MRMGAEKVLRTVCLDKMTRLEKVFGRVQDGAASDIQTVAALSLAALRQARDIIASDSETDAARKTMLQAVCSQLRCRLKTLPARKGDALTTAVQETIRMGKVAATWHPAKKLD